MQLEDFSSLCTAPEGNLPTVACVGVFDGVHLGHCHFIHRLVERAQRTGCRSAVITLFPHPLAVLAPERCIAQLASLEQRIELLQRLGVDLVLPLRFDRALAGLDAEEFISVLARSLHVMDFVIGHDFALGRGRRGSASLLIKLGKRLGFGVEEVSALVADDCPISSTAIRSALSRGDAITAEAYLGRSFRLEAKSLTLAQHGDHAVAQFEVPPPQLVPAAGSYSTSASLDGRDFTCLTTVDAGCRLVRVYLPSEARGFASSLILSFTRRLDDEGPFSPTAGLLVGRAT